VVLIAGLGVMALGLLSLRQQRLQAMHELAATRLRQGSHDARLWALRSEIAALVTPERIGTMSPEAGR
jgi:hypothetical protein